MFLIAWVILAFILGLPFSFGIGYLIGHLVCKISNVERGKTAISVMSGFAFISAQPISFFTVLSLPGVDTLLSFFSGVAYHTFVPIILLVSFTFFLTIMFAFCIALIVRICCKKKQIENEKTSII